MVCRKPEPGKLGEDVDVAINIALELKRRWLCCSQNRGRLKSALLPIGLGIGVHAGTTYLREMDEPEGYAINLAKRVEGYSRNGKFSHVYISEAAHGHLNQLPDELTYLFTDPQTVPLKGISQHISVYELSHHFLPSDWMEESAADRRARSLLDPGTVDITR